MALTADYIQSLNGLAPELRDLLVQLLGEISGGTEEYVLPAATTSTLGGVKQAAAVTDPEDAAEAAAIVTSFKALTASLRAAGILQA